MIKFITMIEFNNVSKSYHNGHVGLANVSFKVDIGEFLFVTGHSGAGKSTLLRMLLAQEKPSSGKIMLNDRDLTHITQAGIPFLRRQIGVVFQNHQLLFDRSVFDNVALPLQIMGFNAQAIKRRVSATLSHLGIHDKIAINPVNLSTGQQQRVGIARAIVHNPPLILADEPTGNLDPNLAAEVMHILELINKKGSTVIVASHDLALIARMRHRLITLQRSRLISDTNAHEKR